MVSGALGSPMGRTDYPDGRTTENAMHPDAQRPTHRTSAPGARRGFSIPELLVVLAIIAIVVAILIPSITGVRARSRTLKCMTNQRTIALALYSYATSNATRFPSPRTDSTGTYYLNGTDVVSTTTPCWVKAEGAFLAPGGQFERPEAIENGTLFPYVGEITAYLSPDEPTNPYVQATSSTSVRVRSYSLNALLGSTRPDELPEFDDDFTSTTGPMGGVVTPLSRYNSMTIGTVKSPQRMMCTIVEDDTVAYNNQGWLIYPQNPTWVDWPAAWRPDAITLTYVDGSTDSRALADPTLPQKWETFGHRWVDTAGTDNAFDWRWFRDRLNPGVIPNSTTGFMTTTN
jgi:prepilin-type N-terminal cleavage/methylation domain-containing protein